MNKDKVLNDYIAFKSVNVKTKNKLDQYKRYVELFLNASKKPISQFSEQDLTNALIEGGKKYNTKTMNEFKTTLKNFIIWHFPDYPQRFRNKDNMLRHLKVEPTYSDSDMISKADFEKLVKGEESILWKAYWLTLFYGGFRPSEALNLKWDSIRFNNDGTAFVEDILITKTTTKTTKFLPDNVVFYLKKLKDTSSSEYLFPSRQKVNNKIVPMERNAVNKRLAKLSLRVLGKRINPYLLRHSIATLLYSEEGKDKDYVAQQMGHSRNMEKVYTHLNLEEKKKRLRKLFIESEDLPPEKKEEYEKQLAEQGKLLKEYMLKVDSLLNDGYEKLYKKQVGDKFEEAIKVKWKKK